MANEATQVKIVVNVENRDAIDLLKKQVLDLQKATSSGAIDLSAYGEKIRDAFKASTGSSEALKAQIALWEKVRSNVSATNPVYAQASAEIVTLRKNLDQLSSSYTHVTEVASRTSAVVGGGANDMARRYLGLGPKGPNPEELAAAAEQRTKLLENVGLGVGFPLLFGGGLGSILGGGLGSFVGAGFAGQIIGSAIGAKFDEFAKSATDFAASLREGGDAAGYLKQSLGYLSPEVASQISNLQQSGQTAEAARVAFEELGKQIGTENAKSVQEFGEGWDRFTRGFKISILMIEASVVQFSQILENLKLPDWANNFLSFTSATGKGLAGVNLGPVGSMLASLPDLANLAPKVKEPALSQAAQDRISGLRDELALTQAQSEAAKNILKDNTGLYAVQQQQVALADKIKEYNKIDLEYIRGKLDKHEKILRIQILEENYQRRLNEIDRQVRDETVRRAEEAERNSEAAARKAKEEQDKAHRLEKDRAQIWLQAIDTNTQVMQMRQQASAWSQTELQAAKDKLALLDKIDLREKAAFEQRSIAEQNEAAIKGTTDQTLLLISAQNDLLLEQQKIRRQNQIVAIAELQATEETTRVQRQGTLLANIAQGNAANAGLKAGIARSFGLPTTAFDRMQLGYQQQARYLQQVITPQEELDARRNQMLDLESKGQNVDALRKEVQYRQDTISSAKEMLAVQTQLENQQQRINEATQKYGFVFDSISQGLSNTFDELIKGTDNWGASLRNIAANVLQDIAKQLFKIYVIDQSISILKSAFGGFGGGGSGGSVGPSADIWANINKYSANGNVFSYNGLVPYAMGGIVNRPTIFPFANGGAGRLGLMGEAGPEAIIPLRRGPGGRLGIEGGGGTTNVVVNVDAKGTSVRGDDGRGEQLGRVVSQAVQAELIKQRRPGGLLAA